MSTLRYIKSFITDRHVASITPSSAVCVRHVCRKIDFSKDLAIVEFGPGLGVFSRYIREHMSEGSRLIMIERNHDFVLKLNALASDNISVVEDSAEALKRILGQAGLEHIDYVVSGIPFSFLNETQKLDILRTSRDHLRKNGKFLAYQTSGHLKGPLRKVFGNVHTEFELLNIPPMTIYEAEKRH